MSTVPQEIDVADPPIVEEIMESERDLILADLDVEAKKLEAASSRLNALGRQEHSKWQTYASQDVEGALARFFEKLAAVHRTHLDTLVATPSEAQHAEALLRYRRSVNSDVLKTVLDRLEKKNLGDQISGRFLKTLDAISAGLVEVPEAVRLHQPDSLFHPSPEDSGLVGMRKAAFRTRLGIEEALKNLRDGLRQLFKKEVLVAVPRSRIVAARQIAEYQLNVVLADQVAPEFENLQRSVATRISAAEKAITDWTNAVLMEERQAEVIFEADQGPDWARLPAPEPPAGDSTPGTAPPPEAETDSKASAEASKDPIPELFERVQERGRALQTALEKVASAAESEMSDDTVDLAFDSLSADFARAGTFLLPLSRRDTSRVELPRSNIVKSGELWKAWHNEAFDRLRYLTSLLGIRDHMLMIERDLVLRLSQATVDPVITTFSESATRLNKAASAAAEAGKKTIGIGNVKEVVSSLQAIQRRLANHFDAMFRDLPGLVSSDQALTDPGRPEWEAMRVYADSLPERLSMHSLEDDEKLGRKDAKPVDVQLRSLVKDALVIALPDRLRKPAESLRSAVRRVWTETESVQHIIQYNMEAALEELHRSGQATDPADDLEEDEERVEVTPGETASEAVKLSVDGLTRASQSLGQLALTLQPAWQEFVSHVDREFLEDWVAIHRRIRAADSAEEQWAGLRDRLTRHVEKAAGRASEFLKAGSVVGLKLLRVGRRRAESLIKIGQSAVGVIDSGEVSRFETAEALARVGELKNGLPLIYRRLFSFDPLDEVTLLEGRSRDLVWVKQHFGRWKNSRQLGVVIIQASLGSGRTSFLQALSSSIFTDVDVRYVNLPERIYHPDEFASLIAGALGVDDPAVTLDELEELLAARKRSERPIVCLIDNLEHLVLRAAQTVNVLERVILFLSHTDRSIYYVGMIGAYTWQFLTRTAGTAVGFVDSYALSPLDRTTIESLITNRHRRSGLSLNFLDPSDPSAIMKQRLRRAKTPENRQSVIREDYFDRLWKASGENIMLGLYYWVRSAQFEDDNSTLTVRPLKPLNFEFLSAFDLNQAFTLKAFFLHKTLSLSDHSKIFHMGEDASTAILESLVNSYVIEPVPTSERGPVPADYHVRRDAIYRLRPLLIHPVTALLQSKNIVY